MNFSYPSNLQEFLSANDEWVRSMASNPKEDVEYWEQVNLVVSQFEGMYEGNFTLENFL